MTSANLDIERSKELAIQFLQYITDKDADKMCEMVTPNWRLHGGPPDLPEGPEGVRKLFSFLSNGKEEWTVEDVIAEGNKVVTRATNICVQDSFFGIPAAGIQQKFSAMFIHKITDGKIEETWRNANDLSRLFQFGAKISK